MDAEELRARYAAGETKFVDAELSEANLKSAYLCRADLSRADLFRADLFGAYLSKTNLSRANLSEAILLEADLSEANLSRANLSRARLSGSNLNGADLSRAELSAAILLQANLSRANLSRAYLGGTCLIEVNLSEANLSEANLSRADLSRADLSRANLRSANLSNADLSRANLRSADLFEADLTNTNLSGAKMDGTILAHQEISEELRREKQELAEQVHLLQAQLEELRQTSNQGIAAPYKWNGLYFRSKTEIKIAEALDRAGVLFYPNCRTRLSTSVGRENKETDFLVFHQGKWGILEVDGEPWHPPSRTVHDHERDRLFKVHGIRIVEHYDATRCWEQPDRVVQEFLEILRQA